MAGCNIAMAYFTSKHVEKLNVPYMVQWAKDMRLMKSVVATYGVEYTNKLIDTFFRVGADDEWIQKTGFTVGIFYSQISKLLLSVNKEKEEEQSNYGEL